MAAQIKAAELYRVIWNALLFVDKNSPTGPVAEFTLNGSELMVRSADGYSGLIERTYLSRRYMKKDEQPVITWYMRKEDLQDAAKKLKTEPEATTVDAMLLHEQEVDCPDAQAWRDLSYLTHYVQGAEKASTFAFSHDRLKLLYRVRPGGDYPIVFRMSELPPRYADQPGDREEIIEFSIGPDIRGYVAPLEHIELNEQ